MKLPYVLVLLAATLSFLSFAQEPSVVAHFMDDKGNCDRQLKLIILKDATTDSTIWSITDSICDLNIPLSFSVSNYLLKIKTAEGFLIERSFQFSDSSAIDLGSISMYPIAKEIEDVTITGVQKKFIVVDAEKTTITVEGNAVLEVSSIYDAILKIPGILPFPGGGFAMSGQLASVYFEGIPSTLGTSDLENLLKSLPATSVQKIELISNPGASYDATTTGAIIDIISQGRVTKWISGTVTLNSGFNVNQKLMPSLMLSGRGKKYTWQLSTGYTYFKKDYRETYNRQYNYFDTATSFLATRREFTNDQNVYFRPSLTYRINKNSFLQVNLGATIFRNKIKGNAMNEVQSDQSLTNFNRKGSGNQVSAGLKYRLFLDTLKRKMEITVNVNRYDYFSNRLTTQEFYGKSYSLIQNSNLNNSFFIRGDFEIPLPKLKSQINLGAKYSYFDALSSGNYNLNDTLELTLDSRNFSSTIPFKYREQNQAVYGEWKQKIGKNISVTAGLRVENFSLNGKLLDSTVVERQYFNLFPSVHALYKIADPIILTANYSRKINMPNYSQFDPNLNGYYDNFTSSSGNPALSPNFSHRAGAKLTIFDYLELSATYNLSNSTNLSEVTADSNSFVINQTYRTYKNVGTVSYFMAIPVPFGMFKSGLDFFNQAIDVDAISFMYIYADRNKTTIPNYNYVNGNNPWWSFGFYSQVMLLYKIRLNIEYDYTAKGMYFISETTKGIHDMEIVVSREFKDDRWRASISVQDVFNSYAEYGRTSYLPLTLSSYSKADTRAVWFKLSYSFGRYERPSADYDSGIPSKGDK